MNLAYLGRFSKAPTMNITCQSCNNMSPESGTKYCNICAQKSFCTKDGCNEQIIMGAHKFKRCSRHTFHKTIKRTYDHTTKVLTVSIIKDKCNRNGCSVHTPSVDVFAYGPSNLYNGEHDMVKPHTEYPCNTFQRCTHCMANAIDGHTRCAMHAKVNVCKKCNKLFDIPDVHLCNTCVSKDIERLIGITCSGSSTLIKYKVCEDGKHKMRQKTFKAPDVYKGEYDSHRLECKCKK